MNLYLSIAVNGEHKFSVAPEIRRNVETSINRPKYCAEGIKSNKMSVSIMEALQNADYNLENAMKMPMLLPLVKEQLHNATVLLDKGYGIWDEVEPLLEEFGSVENVPEKGGEE